MHNKGGTEIERDRQTDNRSSGKGGVTERERMEKGKRREE